VVVFAFAVPAWVTVQVAGRAFYARQDMWRPMGLGTAVAVAAVALYAGLARGFGAAGIAAAGVIAMSVHAALLLAMLRRVHGGPPLAPLAATCARALLLACLCGLAARSASALGDAAWSRLAAGGVAFAVAAAAGSFWLADPALRDTLARGLARLRGGGA
jgi:peptidoglycan biosynthesis protein MviN/MurJ (putative lipid II flippase)